MRAVEEQKHAVKPLHRPLMPVGLPRTQSWQYESSKYTQIVSLR